MTAYATPFVDSYGRLVGGHVVIGYQQYHVEFLSGSCSAVFDGCDSSSDFTFQTLAKALQASQALLDQVFVDGVLGDFGSDPRLTLGCEGASPQGCFVITPYSTNLAGLQGGTIAANHFGNQIDTVSSFMLNGADVTRAIQQPTVFARYTVPEPGTMVLTIIALAAVYSARRWRNEPSNR